MHKQFRKEKDYDGSQGMCCCKWDNHQGARFIMRLDSVNILSPLRVIFSLWSIANQDKLPLYSKVRYCTFWLQALLLFGGTLGWIFYEVLYSNTTTNQAFSLIYVLIDIIVILIDFHWTKVVNYYARNPPKKKYVDKKTKADERKAKEKLKKDGIHGYDKDPNKARDKNDLEAQIARIHGENSPALPGNGAGPDFDDPFN